MTVGCEMTLLLYVCKLDARTRHLQKAQRNEDAQLMSLQYLWRKLYLALQPPKDSSRVGIAMVSCPVRRGIGGFALAFQVVCTVQVRIFNPVDIPYLSLTAHARDILTQMIIINKATSPRLMVHVYGNASTH